MDFVVLVGGGRTFAVDLPAFPCLDPENPLRVMLSMCDGTVDLDSASLVQVRGWPVDAECMAEVIRCALEPSVYALPERFAGDVEFRDRLTAHFEYFSLPVEKAMTLSERTYVLLMHVILPAQEVYCYFVPEKLLPKLLTTEQLDEWGGKAGGNASLIRNLVHEKPGVYMCKGKPDMSVLPAGSVVSCIISSLNLKTML